MSTKRLNVPEVVEEKDPLTGKVVRITLVKDVDQIRVVHYLEHPERLKVGAKARDMLHGIKERDPAQPHRRRYLGTERIKDALWALSQAKVVVAIKPTPADREPTWRLSGRLYECDLLPHEAYAVWMKDTAKKAADYFGSQSKVLQALRVIEGSYRLGDLLGAARAEETLHALIDARHPGGVPEEVEEWMACQIESTKKYGHLLYDGGGERIAELEARVHDLEQKLASQPQLPPPAQPLALPAPGSTRAAELAAAKAARAGAPSPSATPELEQKRVKVKWRK